MRRQSLVAAAALLAVSAAAVLAQRPDAFSESREHPAIAYNRTPVQTAVTDLDRRLQEGSARFAFDPTSGYLPSTLTALGVPIESQALVYTPSSLQAQKITMQNPRALYFNDSVSVAWVRGGTVLEVSAQDPRQGTIFYTMDQQLSGTPHFERQVSCLSCHLSWDTVGVPGPFVLTTYPRTPTRDFTDGFTVDHRSDMAKRWGGWYVTGSRVPARHLGNMPLFSTTPPPEAPARRTVEGAFDLTGYPTPFSDIVALMVLEHQTRMTNLITWAGWEARLGDAARVRNAANDLVDYMLFVGEAPWPDGPIRGSSGFAEKFSAMGPRDARGRSLRELQLETRLMNYPLSYMIYTPSYDALPAAAKEAVELRLRQVLRGGDSSPKYAHLTPAIRQAIVEILRDTRPGVIDGY